MKPLLRVFGALFVGLWRVLDGLRRTLLNLLLLLVLTALALLWWTRGQAPLADRTALVLRLDGALVEQYAGSARQRALSQLQGRSVPHQARLRDVLRALELAETDPKISVLLLDVDDLASAGLASLHEVRDALLRFKRSGKPVLAYAEHLGQKGYYLAAHADQLHLHPFGLVMLDGFGGYRTYFKDALDRLGVQAHVMRVGSFKNAAEPYTANAPSAATREADTALYGELWSRFVGELASARQLTADDITGLIDALPERLAKAGGQPAALALEAKWVDGLKTRDEFRALVLQHAGRDEAAKSFRQIGFEAYLARQATPVAKPNVAIVVAEGEIVDGETGPGRVGGDSTARLVRRAREDEGIQALVLRVSSPGGSVFASELIRREVELTRQAGKPVVVSMGDVAASGGYWISMGANRVLADPSTVTGSIGVFSLLPTAEGLLGKLSLRTGGTTTTWLKGAYDLRRPLDPRMESLLQTGVDHIYDTFIRQAAAARGKTPAEIDASAQGRVWTGAQALERSLIDGLGSLQAAVQSAAELAKLTAPATFTYLEREPGRTERWLARLVDGAVPLLVEPAAPGLQDLLPAGWQEEAALLQAAARLGQDGAWAGTVWAHCLCRRP
ncbi:signal peptide peptidase SppA [Roseateles paludis]|jgi:protease-4|uniref:Signal peptide peptidase SppA n=1 Tax=Roseateles paludis TaxID=3145238 RepID=A0ABV0G715_9BURK